MRLRFGLIMIILVVVTGLVCSPLVRTMATPSALTEARVPQHLREQAIRSPAFVVPKDQWLEFDLAEGPSRVRVLTNANLNGAVADLTDEELLTHEWAYRIRYELLGSSDVLLDSGDYHFRTKLDRYRDPDSGDDFAARFYDGLPSFLAATRETAFNGMPAASQPRWLRLRLESADPDVEEVIARVYCLLDHPDSQLDKTWQKLSEARRELLADGCAYPHDLLVPSERRNLLRSVWSPLAPAGFEGHSYTQRPLLLLQDVEPFQVRDIPAPTGFLVYDQFHAMLPVPAEPGRVRLEFQAFSTAEKPVPPQTVELHWYGHRAHERRVTTFHFGSVRGGTRESFEDGEPSTNPILTNPATDGLRILTNPATQIENALTAISQGSNRWTCEFEAEDGMFELRSATPLVISADWQPAVVTTADHSSDITPPPAYLRTYATTIEQPVNFSVSHLEDSPTVVRLSIRSAAGQTRRPRALWTDPNGRQKADLNSLFADPTGTIPPQVAATIEWRYLDENNNIVRSGALSGDLAWSAYDRLSEDVLTTRVSEPIDFYFDVPHNVAQLQIVTKRTPLFLSAATRPLDIAKVTAVPEDYSGFTRGDTDNRSWFAMRAIGHEELLQFGLAPLLVTQTRPPKDDEDLAAGRYMWEDFPPNGDWQGRYVLTPRDPQQSMAEDIAPALFYELNSNAVHHTRLLADPGKRTVSPTLVYRFGEVAPSPIRVFIGGELHQEILPQSNNGEISLLPCMLDDAEQQIQLDCNAPVQLWMSRIEPRDGQPWLKRLAVEFDRPSFEFVYHKQSADEERASLSVFRSQSAMERLDLRVSVRPMIAANSNEPAHDFTLRDRVFSLAPSDEAPALMLPAQRDLVFDVGRACLIPFGLDLPKGDYRIHIERNSLEDQDDPSEDVYFIFSRTTSGVFDVRDITIETVHGGQL